MPNGQPTLADAVRAKYPGAYDDMDDANLEQKVLAKYPQYSDMPRSQMPFDMKTGTGAMDYASQQAHQRSLGTIGTPEQARENPKFMSLQDYANRIPLNELGGVETPEHTAQDVGTEAALLGTLLPGLGEATIPRAAMSIGRTALGGTAGAAGGAYMGRELGSPFGKTGEEIGEALGTLGGGVLGGTLAGGLKRLPATPLESQRGVPGRVNPLPFGIQRFIPDWMVPKGELGSETNPGWYSAIPARIKRGSSELGLSTTLGGRTGSATEPFEPLVYESPEEAAAIDQRSANLRRQAKAAGTYHAAQGSAKKATNLQQRILRAYER